MSYEQKKGIDVLNINPFFYVFQSQYEQIYLKPHTYLLPILFNNPKNCLLGFDIFEIFKHDFVSFVIQN